MQKVNQMSTPETSNSFEAIHDDYAFFEAHSTEAAADVRGYLPHLKQLAAGTSTIRFLDFGCGPGNFTAKLLAQAQLPPERLQLTLVEPDAGYLQQAAVRLQPYSTHPIHTCFPLPADLSASFDTILSNHVLYFVPALQQAICAILGALAKPGLFLASMAGFPSVLIQLWTAGFDQLKRPLPYYTAEDLEQVLSEMAVPFQIQRIEYEINFPDSTANRMHILRFLLSAYLSEVDLPTMLALFEPYKQGERIIIPTTHQQYIVKV